MIAPDRVVSQDARYLKHSGKKINIKVTITILADKTPVLNIMDFQYRESSKALAFLQRCAEQIVDDSPRESVAVAS